MIQNYLIYEEPEKYDPLSRENIINKDNPDMYQMLELIDNDFK